MRGAPNLFLLPLIYADDLKVTLFKKTRAFDADFGLSYIVARLVIYLEQYAYAHKINKTYICRL